jgi:hypothetical protein
VNFEKHFPNYEGKIEILGGGGLEETFMKFFYHISVSYSSCSFLILPILLVKMRSLEKPQSATCLENIVHYLTSESSVVMANFDWSLVRPWYRPMKSIQKIYKYSSSIISFTFLLLYIFYYIFLLHFFLVFVTFLSLRV